MFNKKKTEKKRVLSFTTINIKKKNSLKSIKISNTRTDVNFNESSSFRSFLFYPFVLLKKNLNYINELQYFFIENLMKRMF